MIAVCMTYFVCFLHSPYCLWRVIKFRSYLTAFAKRYHLQIYEGHSKKNYPPLDRDRVFDRYMIFFQSLIYVPEYAIPAIIEIVTFSMMMLPHVYYCQTPMPVIGKFYSNSMLFLINSRMLLGSEEAPLTIITAVRFNAAPVTANDSAHITEISQSGQNLQGVQA